MDIVTSSQTTTYPGMHGIIPTPYPPSSSKALHPQQPLGFLYVGNQVQNGKLFFIASPGIFPTNWLGRENVATVNPALGTTTTNLKYAEIALGGVQIIIGLVHVGFGVVLGLLSTSYCVSQTFSSTAFAGGFAFWDGICFHRFWLILHISIQGIVSLSGEKHPHIINIISAIIEHKDILNTHWAPLESCDKNTSDNGKSEKIYVNSQFQRFQCKVAVGTCGQEACPSHSSWEAKRREGTTDTNLLQRSRLPRLQRVRPSGDDGQTAGWGLEAGSLKAVLATDEYFKSRASRVLEPVSSTLCQYASEVHVFATVTSQGLRGAGGPCCRGL
ncbi:uncharacterized protein LOC129670688 [Psammomys obesus]|uniref:uncharacterized protein LOC129670688 n=1 Tax=Psammomys obesus TaxID=48139 RepID=UPI00245362A5|nr:uncharacterized protein LOC129670688 [Psammomys obesus]